MIDRKTKQRPCPGGVSIGHYQVTAGTLGCWVKKNGQSMMLSNNHVLANVNQADIGDPIYQPGAYDGGTSADEIGKLYRYVPISMTKLSNCPIAGFIAASLNFVSRIFGRKTRLIAYAPGESNKVDCAIAEPNSGVDVLDRILEDDGTLIRIDGETEAKVGLLVKKSGRTTGTTRGIISQTDVTVNVNMGDSKIAIFTDQVVVEKEGMSAGGDSGSAVLTEDNRLVGLLFAGSDKAMIANRWSNVKETLGLD
ncbi:MAG: hypothetical protein Q7T57_03835 [Dehalococcoidales bacterium]|nr:hypothetical protein [Dehalococcoidales bacterium]